MTTETIRTVTPEIHMHNIRARIALLTLRSISRLLTIEEIQELKELHDKLTQLEKQS